LWFYAESGINIFMPVFKTTDQLLSTHWPENTETPIENHPRKYDWLKNRSPKFSDIDVWEQVYSEPGNIGIYAAWSPFVEVYVIVHYLFDKDQIEWYTDLSDIISRTEKLGIELPVNRVWIPN
jgi:hypothetical protein